jgi:hypothetical protein
LIQGFIDCSFRERAIGVPEAASIKSGKRRIVKETTDCDPKTNMHDIELSEGTEDTTGVPESLGPRGDLVCCLIVGEVIHALRNVG